jgi:hypothetical protein
MISPKKLRPLLKATAYYGLPILRAARKSISVNSTVTMVGMN